MGTQKRARSDKTGFGVMLAIDTETGFAHAVLIDGAWGLRQTVVHGMVCRLESAQEIDRFD